MNTTRIKIADVTRGSMIPGAWGVMVADTLSATEDGTPMWIDTNAQRHVWARDGYAVVYVPTVQTRAVGQSLNGGRHALRTAVPGQSARAYCGSRATLDVWTSGTALASVTCRSCRGRLNLVGDFRIL